MVVSKSIRFTYVPATMQRADFLTNNLVGDVLVFDSCKSHPEPNFCK